MVCNQFISLAFCLVFYCIGYARMSGITQDMFLWMYFLYVCISRPSNRRFRVCKPKCHFSWKWKNWGYFRVCNTTYCQMAPCHYLNQLPLVRYNDIQLRAIHERYCTSGINHWINLKITYLKYDSNLPGANELNWFRGPAAWALCPHTKQLKKK